MFCSCCWSTHKYPNIFYIQILSINSSWVTISYSGVSSAVKLLLIDRSGLVNNKERNTKCHNFGKLSVNGISFSGYRDHYQIRGRSVSISNNNNTKIFRKTMTHKCFQGSKPISNCNWTFHEVSHIENDSGNSL